MPDLNKLEASIDGLVTKKHGKYEINYEELDNLKKLMSTSDMSEQSLHILSYELKSKSEPMKILLFSCIDILFKNVKEFRKPFLRYLQTSLMKLLSNLSKNHSGVMKECKYEKSIIKYVVEWNYMFKHELPQVLLCYNFVKSKYSKEVKVAESELTERNRKEAEVVVKKKEEKFRNYEHILSVFRENKNYIISSLTIVENCFQLLVPDFTKESLTEEKEEVKEIIHSTQSAEFSGPSTNLGYLLADNYISLDISKLEKEIEIYQTRDNEDVIKNLRDNMKLILKRYCPLLKKILKEMNSFEISNEILKKEVSKLIYRVFGSIKKFEGLHIIHNEMSYNLMGSDSEGDDEEFEDVL